MKITIKKYFKVVEPEYGCVLINDINEVFNSITCPLDCEPSDYYTEITQEQYEELLINQQSDEIMEDDNDGSNDNWTNN